MSHIALRFDPEPSLALTAEQANELLEAFKADQLDQKLLEIDGGAIYSNPATKDRFYRAAMGIWNDAGMPPPVRNLILEIFYPPVEIPSTDGILRYRNGGTPGEAILKLEGAQIGDR
jgi:hypothetical protein